MKILSLLLDLWVLAPALLFLGIIITSYIETFNQEVPHDD